MYCEYKYNAGQTAANLLSDLVGVLTGTITDKANFSAGVNQVTTGDILTTYNPPGWEVWDAASGPNTTVIRAPCDGDASQFKYVRLNTNTAGFILIELYESWDEVNHTGINLAQYSNLLGGQWNPTWSATDSGELFISSSNRRLVIMSRHSSAPTLSTYCILEANRTFTWCAVGQGFVPVMKHGSISLTFTRHVSSTGTILNTTSGNTYSATMKGAPYNATNRVRLANGLSGITLGSITTIAHDYYPQFDSFDISEVYSLGHIGPFAVLDEFVYAGKTRVILQNIGNGNNNTNYIYPVVPKG